MGTTTSTPLDLETATETSTATSTAPSLSSSSSSSVTSSSSSGSSITYPTDIVTDSYPTDIVAHSTLTTPSGTTHTHIPHTATQPTHTTNLPNIQSTLHTTTHSSAAHAHAHAHDVTGNISSGNGEVITRGVDVRSENENPSHGESKSTSNVYSKDHDHVKVLEQPERRSHGLENLNQDNSFKAQNDVKPIVRSSQFSEIENRIYYPAHGATFEDAIDGLEKVAPALDVLPRTAGERSGWKVLGVADDGPCGSVGIIPYMDIITHVNNNSLNEYETTIFSNLHANVPTDLTLFSLSTLSLRTVRVTPNRDWGGGGLLGLSIRYGSIENAYYECMRVLGIKPNSPASAAQLHANSDYLLGTSKIAFRSYDQLDFWLNVSDQRPSDLYIYNSITHRVRMIMITPNTQWGGGGSLGCDVAIGDQHSLPLPRAKASPNPSMEKSGVPSWIPVAIELESNMHLGSPHEQRLVRHDGQLFMNLMLAEKNSSVSSSSVSILSLRIKEWEEYELTLNHLMGPNVGNRDFTG